ncbi:MAG: peptidase, partial [Flavobacterium sp.]|nr:peptidase [Flavobacterium sp.]
MKKITLFIVLISLFGFGSYAQQKKKPIHFGKEIAPEKINSEGYIKCLTDEYEDYLQSIDPKRMNRDQFEAWLAPLIEEQKNIQQVASQSGGIIYIPVVVHVIHNGDAYGTNENITDEQVQSQITVMTQDFRRMAGTPGFNNNPVGADVQIEFVLAKVDPNGNPTNGINRVNLCQASWSTTAINSTVKPQTIWDSSQYMNMWSVNFSNAQLLGFAQFPDGSGLAGLNPVGGAADTDGVVA